MDKARALTDVTIYEFLPGYRFRVKFSTSWELGTYDVDVEEDIEYNLKFNKNSSYTFDDFSKEFLATTIPEQMKLVGNDIYVLTFVIFNDNILQTKNIPGYSAGLICVDIKNESGQLTPDLYESFCKQFQIPGLKALYKGNPSEEPGFFEMLMKKSSLSNEGCYGLILKSNFTDVTEIFLSNQDFSSMVVDKDLSEELLRDFVVNRSTSDFTAKSLAKYGGTPFGRKKAYASLCTAIAFDEYFVGLKEEIISRRGKDWLDNELKSLVKENFKPILDEMASV